MENLKFILNFDVEKKGKVLVYDLAKVSILTIWGTRLSFKYDHNIRAHILQYCYCKKRNVSTEESITQLSSDTAQAC